MPYHKMNSIPARDGSTLDFNRLDNSITDDEYEPLEAERAMFGLMR